MKWWGWLTIAVFGSAAWFGIVSVFDGFSGLDRPENAIFGGIGAIVALSIGAPILLAARR